MIRKILLRSVAVVMSLTALSLPAQQARNLLTPVSAKNSRNAISTVHGQFHNFQSYFSVATRWRLVTVDVPVLVGAGLDNVQTATANEGPVGDAPNWVKSAAASSTTLNLFDDVTIGLGSIRQTNRGRERSYRETLDGDRYPIDVRSYDISGEGKLNGSPDLSVSGGRVKMGRLILGNGLMYSLFPIGPAQREDISALKSPRKIPHIVFEFDPKLPGTMEVLTPDEFDGPEMYGDDQ